VDRPAAAGRCQLLAEGATISSYVIDSLATLAQMKSYRGFPERLHHRVPHWVEPGALFHIRIRLDRENQQKMLIDPSLPHALLDSATLYETNMRWHITLFLLMPDHVHAVLSFPRDKSMSEVIGDWKRFHNRTYRVMWQEGYFDHRLRPDERGTQFSAKLNYIRQNPVAAGLCTRAEEWPWLIDPFASKGGSVCPQDDAS
jgi:putative transposase